MRRISLTAKKSAADGFHRKKPAADQFHTGLRPLARGGATRSSPRRIRVLPRFAPASTQAAEWSAAYADRAALLAHAETMHELPVDDWLFRVARVRPKVHDLEKVVQLAAAFGRAEPELTPLQLPYVPGQPWLALELPPELDPATLGERLLYTAILPGGLDVAAPAHVVLVLDEWTEVIPARQETAGLAFHYDRPSHEPPQSLLLVVPASSVKTWTWAELALAIPETFDLARERAVEPRDLAATPLARFLPATLMASTASPISIGSRLLGGHAADFRRAFAVPPPPAPTDEAGARVLAHREAWQHQAAFGDRAVDGRRVYEWLLAHPRPRDLTTLPAPLAIADGDRDVVNDLFDAFVAWFERRVVRPAGSADGAWTRSASSTVSRAALPPPCSRPPSTPAARSTGTPSTRSAPARRRR